MNTVIDTRCFSADAININSVSGGKDSLALPWWQIREDQAITVSDAGGFRKGGLSTQPLTRKI
ncbi:N-type ATP pyrophosphatase [Pectobacterium phage PcCB7V]|nr:N-type ATP pyrophosphatase [Pectobacterium phage PcCB7V]